MYLALLSDLLLKVYFTHSDHKYMFMGYENESETFILEVQSHTVTVSLDWAFVFVIEISFIPLRDSINCQEWIQDFPRGQLLKPKVANIAKQSCTSRMNNLQLGSKAHLRIFEDFWFLKHKICILQLFFSPFWQLVQHQIDKIVHYIILQ